jgi:hypothetical protein
MPDKKRGVDKEHQSQQTNRASLQAISHAIHELRDSIDGANQTAQSVSAENRTEKARITTFFQVWLPVFINIMLLVVVVSQAVYAYRQWQEMKRAERAWVVVHDTGFAYVKDLHQVPRAGAVVGFINTGPSPAFRVTGVICAQVRSTEPGIEERPSENCRANRLGIMGSNVAIKFDAGDPTQEIPENSLPSTAYEPGPHLYVWGRVDYETFAKDGTHFTSFCLLSAGKQLAPCTNGNDGN